MPLNVATLKFSNAVQIMTDLLSCPTGDRCAIMVHGSPGTGKSAVPREAIRIVAEGEGVDPSKFFFQVVMLSQLDQVDLRGIPVPDMSGGVTRWLTPDFFPRDPKARGFLFLDEFNAAPQSVMAPAYQLLLDHQLGNYHVPEGIRIVAAGNLDSDKAIVSRTSSAARNRLQHFRLEADIDEWVQWALTVGNIPPEIVAFLRWKPSSLHKFEPEKDLHAYPSPRSWEMAGKFMRRNTVKELEHAGLSGCIGEGQATELVAFIRVARKMPSVEKIIRDPKGTPVPEMADAQYAIAGALAYRANQDNIGQICTYIARMPGEFAAVVMRDCLTRDKSLSRTRAFIDWAKANTSFLF